MIRVHGEEVVHLKLLFIWSLAMTSFMFKLHCIKW